MGDHNRSYKDANQQKSNNNQDFIPFGSPPQSGFSPCNFSSPVNNRANQWSPNYSTSFKKSHNSGRRYSSPHKSFQNKRSFDNSRNGSYSKKNHNNTEAANDNSSFLHPSFLEDPWKKLEEDLKERISNVNK